VRGETGRRAAADVETGNEGITGLAFWDNGSSVQRQPADHTSGRPEGLKMGSQSSKVLEAQMRALDAIPR